jgi:hypothetical protein
MFLVLLSYNWREQGKYRLSPCSIVPDLTFLVEVVLYFCSAESACRVVGQASQKVCHESGLVRFGFGYFVAFRGRGVQVGVALALEQLNDEGFDVRFGEGVCHRKLSALLK